MTQEMDMANLIIFILKNGESFSLKQKQKQIIFFFFFFFFFFFSVFKISGQVLKIHPKEKALKFILFHTIKRPLILSRECFIKYTKSNLLKLECMKKAQLGELVVECKEIF
jgi:hypothetical protein